MQTRLPSTRPLWFSQLSPQRQTLLRLCQQTNFGSIRDVEIRDRQPVFDPPPVVIIDLKLESAEEPRPETTLPDFELPGEVVRLMDQLDQLGTTKIDSLEAFRANNIGFVMLDREKAPPALVEYVEQTLPLVLIVRDGRRTLYRVP